MYHPLMLLAGMLVLYRSVYFPSVFIIAVLTVIFIGLWKFNRINCRLVATLLFGYCWAAGFSIYSANQNLPQVLINQAIELEGCVINLKNHSLRYQRLVLDVQQARYAKESIDFNGKVSLANYKPLDKSISPGWCGQFLAVLKPVHGRLNSHGFDYESWAYVNNIHAIGVLKRANNLFAGRTINNRYLQFRSRISDTLKQSLTDSSSLSLVISLALGDRSLMSEEQWTVLRRSGTSHLLAISGLHIGLVFWMVSMITSQLWRVIPSMPLRLSAQKAGWITGLAISASYLALAGFPLSGRRAWIMLFVTVCLLLTDEQTDFKRCLTSAVVLILLIWPSSVLSVGFWFSFTAVGLIMMQFVHVNINLKFKNSFLKSHLIQRITRLITMQFILSIAILPLSILFFGELSLVSLWANIVAIPLVSFVILPTILIGLIVVALGLTNYSELVFAVSQYCLDWLYIWLARLIQFDWAWSMPMIHSQVSLVLILLGIFLWLYFRLWPGRWMLGFMVIPIFINSKPIMVNGEYKLTVFDVGQGLAIWVQTLDKDLLVDTGFGIENGFSYFDGVINPVLKANDVKKLDAAVISHGDADHAGGLKALIQSDLRPPLIYVSHTEDNTDYLYCSNGLNWQWNNIKFEFLTQSKISGENNQSCVLKLSSEFGSVLLPGDIERESELKLVEVQSEKLNSDILIVAHHGSLTSSTSRFLNSVQPNMAVFSAGYLNRYRHPAKKIVDRFQMREINSLNTACQGQITIHITQSGIEVDALRQSSQPFWRHQCSKIDQ